MARRVAVKVTYGTQFKMLVAYGRSAQDAALNGQVIPAKKLEELAGK